VGKGIAKIKIYVTDYKGKRFSPSKDFTPVSDAIGANIDPILI
jgi:hypothetical protein